jgi:hypothetical protein
MRTNIGINDKLVRMILAAVFAVLAFNVNFAFGFVSAAIVLTVVTSWCPIMQMLGKNTCTIPQTQN